MSQIPGKAVSKGGDSHGSIGIFIFPLHPKRCGNCEK